MKRSRSYRRAFQLKGWSKPDTEVQEELAHHIEITAQELVDEGMNPVQARREAERRFGDVERYRRKCTRYEWRNRRFERGREMLSSFQQDVAYSLRSLRKAPGFAAVVVTTLALGIGATTAIFSVVSALLLNPLPYPDADRIVVVWQGRTGLGVDKDWLSPAQYLDIREGSDVFESLALCFGTGVTMTGQGPATELGYAFVSSSFFSMFGATPILGRVFDERDDSGNNPIVAMLTHGLWQTAFGADPDVVGKTITLRARDFQIVGVLSPEFLLDNEVFPTAGAIGHIDVLLSPYLSEQQMAGDRGNESWNVFGMVKPGISIDQVQASIDLVAESITENYEEPGSGFFLRAVPLLEEVVGKVQQGLLVLLSSALMLLLIACGNVANLLLSRANVRQVEMSVRTAIGAPRHRLMRQLLTESALLASIGGALGVALAVVSVRAIRRVGELSLPRLPEIGIHGDVLFVAALATVTTTIVFGLVPALRLSRVDVVGAVRRGRSGAGRNGIIWSRLSFSSGLVIAEIGLSLVVLICAGLLTRSVIALGRFDHGFNAEQMVTFRYLLEGGQYNDPSNRTAFVTELEERLASLPGVSSVGSTNVLPFAPGPSWGEVMVEGYTPPPGAGDGIIANTAVVTPGYFRAMGIPAFSGRTFDERDRADGQPVAVIDQRFAEVIFGDSNPIGRRLFGDGRGGWAVIVGVVGSVSHSASDPEPDFTVYWPHAQIPLGWGYFSIRSTIDPNSLVETIPQTVGELDAHVPVVDLVSMDRRMEDSLAPQSFLGWVLRLFSLVAMTLAAVGIYGLVSYRVSQSTHQLGMRMALGAPRWEVARLVLGHGMFLAGCGVALGLVCAYGLSRVIEAILFGVSASDGPTYLGLSVFLLFTVFSACILPAWRATAVDPLDAIRVD